MMGKGRGGSASAAALASGRRGRGAVAFAFLSLLALCAAPLAAQGAGPAPFRAILQRSQPRSLGLPFLKPNATPAWYGEYRVGTEPAILLRVWFVRTPVFLDAAWSASACGLGLVPGARLRELALSGDRVVAVAEYPDRRLFIEAPAAWAERCRFIALVAERADYFLRYAKDPESFSLPAIVELPAR